MSACNSVRLSSKSGKHKYFNWNTADSKSFKINVKIELLALNVPFINVTVYELVRS